MEIQKYHNKNFLINPSITDMMIEELGIDLTQGPNVFNNNRESKINSTPHSNPNAKSHKVNKRINAYDNELLYYEEVSRLNQTESDSNNFFLKSDSQKVWLAFKRLIKNIAVRLPIINYFVLKEKQNKLKTTLADLNSINSSMDELINSSVPFGEQSDKYKKFSENIVKANNIHAKIKKEIQD